MEDIRLLLAVLAPLIGAGLVMATGKRPERAGDLLVPGGGGVVRHHRVAGSGHLRRAQAAFYGVRVVAGLERVAAGGRAFDGVRAFRPHFFGW